MVATNWQRIYRQLTTGILCIIMWGEIVAVAENTSIIVVFQVVDIRETILWGEIVTIIATVQIMEKFIMDVYIVL